MDFKCPHCGGDINPASVLGSIQTDKKKAAWMKNRNNKGRPKKSKEKKDDSEL